jgi:hypothetical protein
MEYTMPSRRSVLALIGGGVVLASTAFALPVALRKPKTALRPWETAGTSDDPRIRALSFALLAPNPHNRQPWLADLAEPDVVTLYADPKRMLPETDPMNRQITIGFGCFLELLRMAAAEDGYRLDLTPFPDGSSPSGLDLRPVARAVFVKDDRVSPDPLFAHVLDRRTNKEPYDLARPVNPALLPKLGLAITAGSQFGGSVAEADIAALRALTHEALRIEVDTPRTYAESVNLFRIGAEEVDANPDGIDFTGPVFELLAVTGQFTRETAFDTGSTVYQQGMAAVLENCDTAMGHVWLVTEGNSRADQLAAGADWLRLHLAATREGLDLQPLSQALQEYPEMDALYRDIHTRLAPNGGTVQMLARIGCGPATGPSPRWPLETRLING